MTTEPLATMLLAHTPISEYLILGGIVIALLFFLSLSSLVGQITMTVLALTGFVFIMLSADSCHWQIFHVSEDRAWGNHLLLIGIVIMIAALFEAALDRYWNRRRKIKCTVCGKVATREQMKKKGCPQCGSDAYTAVKW